MPTRYIGFGYWEIASRQMSIVSKSEQQRFKDAKITVIGCGGIGGETIEMLARMGLGELTIIDKDEYDLSNLNRQATATLETLGKLKAEATKEKVRITNPYTKVMAINQALDEENVDELLKGSDIIIDALDNLITRIIVSRYARENKIPFIHGAIHGTQGQITVCLEAIEAYKLITGIGKVTYAPKILSFDLLDFGSFGITEL